MDGFNDLGGRFESAPAANLASPPRAIPLLLRLRVLLGGVFGLIGWLELLTSLIFIAIFLPMTDLDSFRFRSGSLGVATGTVTQVERTSGRSNGRYVYANHYVFRIPGQEASYEGVSYATGEIVTPGQAVQIEYLADTPTLSRIQGMRSNLFGPALLLILIMPLVGLVFVVVGVARGMGTLRLLQRGLAATGRVTGRTRTSARINRRFVYRIAYEFADGGGVLRQGRTRSHYPERWQDGQPVAVIYDPANPARANLLDNLPARIGFDDFGNVRDSNSQLTRLIAALPLITILGYLLALGLIVAR